MIKVRTLSWAPPFDVVHGQLVRARSHTYLVLGGPDSEPLHRVRSALEADGWSRFGSDSPVESLVRDAQPFPGPTVWPKPIPSAAGSRFLLDRIQDEWRLARQYERGTRQDVDTECLHQYRVHLRRVRSLVASGEPWARLPEGRRLKAVLGELQRRTNELRDLDVLLLDLPALAAGLPWDEGRRLTEWKSGLLNRRNAEWRQVKSWLESREYGALILEVERLFVDLDVLGEPMTTLELARQGLLKAVRGLRKGLKAARRAQTDEAFHEVRTRAKKLRYALEGLAGLGSQGTVRTCLALLKEAQDGLGRFQDRSVLLERLKVEWTDLRSRPGRTDLLAFGLLVGALFADHGHQREAARRDCDRLRSKLFWRALGRLTEGEGGTDAPGN